MSIGFIYEQRQMPAEETVQRYTAVYRTQGVLKNPDETRGRHIKGRNRRDTGQEEGGTHVFYSSVRLGNSTEPIPGRN